MGRLAEALSQMSDDFLESVIKQAKEDELVSTGKLLRSFKIVKSENGFTLINDSGYGGAVLADGSGKTSKIGKEKIQRLADWAKTKGMQPLLRNKKGRFRKITESSYTALGFILAKSISKKGTIQRFGYKGSNTLQRVADIKMKEWATKISVAFKEDLITQMKAEISFKDLKI